MEKEYDFLEVIEKLKIDMMGICTLGENSPKLKSGIKRADSSFGVPFSKSLIWKTEPMQQFFAN